MATKIWEDTYFRSKGVLGKAAITSFRFPWLATGTQDAYPAGEKFILCVRCEGNRLRGQIDGEFLFDVADTASEALTSGKIGLYAWRNSGARFDSVFVRSWPANLLGDNELYTARLMGSYVQFDSDRVESSWPDDYWKTIDAGDCALVAEGKSWENYQVHVTLEELGK